jgi:hypothetical protein
MKDAVKKGSDAMMYISSFMNSNCDNQKLMRGGIETHRQHCDFIILLVFFQNKGSKKKFGILRNNIRISHLEERLLSEILVHS